VDLRVSTVPTVHGEKVVLRILDASRALKKLSEIGLSTAVFESFSKSLRQPHGLLLVTGPTGSGKTTTLYAALSALNTPGKNIVTLEDPVEYRIDRINQIEAQAKIGLTFAVGLRAILRQDPNVILVGEIRDLETAEIAIQSAITGHLVFSTLHTNDAVSTVHRLLNMRVEPFLLSAALVGVLSQRLIRRLCENCKKPHDLTPAERAALGPLLGAGGSYFRATGCGECLGTAMPAAFAVHEWLPVTLAIRELVLRRASADALKETALAEGLKSLRRTPARRLRAAGPPLRR